MLKEVFAQNNIKSLKKLLDAYIDINDSEEILRVGGKLIQSQDDEIDSQYIIKIFDMFYQILKKSREEVRNLKELENMLSSLGKGNRRRLKYVQEYKEKYFGRLYNLLEKLCKDIDKARILAGKRDKELEIFLQLNYADYKRYLCECTLDDKKLDLFIQETDIAYNDFITLCDKANVCLVSTSYMTGLYHYAIFQFEIKNDWEGAIKYLNIQKSRFIDLLDTLFKNFTDSYEILNLINDTLTNWILLTNAQKQKKELEEAEKERMAKETEKKTKEEGEKI